MHYEHAERNFLSSGTAVRYIDVSQSVNDRIGDRVKVINQNASKDNGNNVLPAFRDDRQVACTLFRDSHRGWRQRW